jgi:hypothetical protein
VRPTVFPTRSPEDAARDVVRLVSRAVDEGFTVVATDIWAADEKPHGSNPS